MNNTKEQGFTLLELLAALAIIGVLSAITTPLVMWANKPLQNGTYQAAGIFSQGRSRAISTTSALRIRANPDDPERSFIVQASDTRSCDPNGTVLTEAVTTNSNELAVVSTQGFAAGDRLKIGDDETENIILTTDSNSATLTLGKPIDSTHSSGTNVEILANWQSDKTFFQEDMILPDTVRMVSNLVDWELCFDSRGIATVSDTFGIAPTDLEITLVSEQSEQEGQITVFQGGMIDSVVIQPKDEILLADAGDTGTENPEDISTPASGSSGDNTDSVSNGDGTPSDTNDSSPPSGGSQEPDTNVQLGEGVIIEEDNPSTDPKDNTVTNDATGTDNADLASNTTPDNNNVGTESNSFNDENLTFEERRVVYQEWLANNEYYQSIVQNGQTVDRDSEPYKAFVKEFIEKLTWLHS